jgi:hypothetical protein
VTTLPLHRHALRAGASADTAPTDGTTLFTVPREYLDGMAELCQADGAETRVRNFAWLDDMDSRVARLLDFIGWAIVPERRRLTAAIASVDDCRRVSSLIEGTPVAIVPIGGAIVVHFGDGRAARVEVGEGVALTDEAGLSEISVAPESTTPVSCAFVRAFDRP